MVFKINDIKSVLSKRGIQRPSHFAVNITPPSGLKNPGIVADIPYLCQAVGIPGVTIDGDSFKHRGYGLQELRPNNVTFDPVMTTLIADGRGEIFKFFNDWMQLIFPTDSGTDTASTEMFAYPNDYYGTIEIYIYDTTAKKHTTVKLEQAFPIVLNTIESDWSTTDDITRLGVNFSYRNRQINAPTAGVSMEMTTGNVRSSAVVDKVVTGSNPATDYDKSLWV